VIETLLKITKRDELNFILTYGLGDTMIIVGLRNVIEKKYGCPVHFIIKTSHKIVMKIYSCDNYSIYEFSADELFGIGKRNYIPHKGLLYVAHPVYSDNKVYMQEWNDSKLSHKALLFNFLHIKENTPVPLPVWRPAITRKMKDSFDFPFPDMNKTVLLLPEARSVFPLSMKYWEDIAIKLRNEGCFVVQSYENNIYNIEGVPVLPDDLDAIIAFALSCKGVYALRNGLCDLIASKVKRMIIFYTTAFHFNAYKIEGENIENILISPEEINHFSKCRNL
jgi:hypothetical protein